MLRSAACAELAREGVTLRNLPDQYRVDGGRPSAARTRYDGPSVALGECECGEREGSPTGGILVTQFALGKGRYHSQAATATAVPPPRRARAPDLTDTDGRLGVTAVSAPTCMPAPTYCAPCTGCGRSSLTAWPVAPSGVIASVRQTPSPWTSSTLKRARKASPCSRVAGGSSNSLDRCPVREGRPGS